MVSLTKSSLSWFCQKIILAIHLEKFKTKYEFWCICFEMEINVGFENPEIQLLDFGQPYN